MVKKGVFDSSIFTGSTINTPSMLAVEDYIDSLNWSKSMGGLNALIDRSNANLNVLKKYVIDNNFIDFLATEENTISNTSICLSFNDINGEQIKAMTKLLEENDVAYDIDAYRDAPPGIRIWGGATVETSDMEKLMPWLTWAYNKVKS